VNRRPNDLEGLMMNAHARLRSLQALMPAALLAGAPSRPDFRAQEM